MNRSAFSPSFTTGSTPSTVIQPRGCAVPFVVGCQKGLPLPKEEDGVKMVCSNKMCPFRHQYLHKECFAALEHHLLERTSPSDRKFTKKKESLWATFGPMFSRLCRCPCEKGVLTLHNERRFDGSPNEPMGESMKFASLRRRESRRIVEDLNRSMHYYDSRDENSNFLFSVSRRIGATNEVVSPSFSLIHDECEYDGRAEVRKNDGHTDSIFHHYPSLLSGVFLVALLALVFFGLLHFLKEETH